MDRAAKACMMDARGGGIIFDIWRMFELELLGENADEKSRDRIQRIFWFA